MILSPSQSTGFVPQLGLAPRQEVPSSFSMSSIPASTSTFTSASTSTSTSASAFTSTSGCEVGVEVGINPSATLLSASVPVQVPVQYPSIPFVPARARMMEFERLREELRRTEMVREQQVEMLQALAQEASHELDAPQFNGPPIHTASVPIPQPIHHTVPGPVPINDSSHVQVNHYNNHQVFHPAYLPTPMTVPMSIPHHYQHQHRYQPVHHHQEPQQCRQLPYAPMSPNYIARGRVTKACENCKSRKVKCDGVCPCERCAGRGLRCIYGERRVRGPTKKRKESRDAAMQQVSSSSPTPPPPPLDVAPTSVIPHTTFTAPLPEPLPVHVPQPQPPPPPLPPQPQTQPPPPPPPSSPPASVWSTLLSAVPSLSRSLFSPPTPAAPTLVSATGQVTVPTSTSPRNDVTRPGSRSGSAPPSSTPGSAVSPAKPASPERFSDEEIQMTLEMPSDPFGTPGGVFDFLDPLQEANPFDDPSPLPDDPSPGFDFIMDFEPDLDSSFEDEILKRVCGDGPTPFVEVNPSPPPVTMPVTVSTLAPRMPTILEEDEKEEEDGDVTITPSEAQRALLPPDRFARPPSAPRVVGAADASQDTSLDPLDTPRPRTQTAVFSAPVPGVFDPGPSPEAGLQSQRSPGQVDFLFHSLMAGETTNPDFDALGVGIPAWDEAAFGESPSQESESSSSSSSWELTSKDESSMEIGMGADVDMGLQFPSVGVDTIGDGNGIPTEEEFWRGIVEVVQSTPKVSTAQDGFELFCEAGTFDV